MATSPLALDLPNRWLTSFCRDCRASRYPLATLHGKIAATIGFVVNLKRDAHRRIFFVSIVEEENFLAAESPGEKRIPKLPDELANRTDGEKAINDWHGKQLRQTLSDANLVLVLLSVES